MKIEMRLKQVLEEHGLFRYGIEKEISADCDLHRHTIGKLLRNQMRNPSLDVLEKVCWWLRERGVPAEILPGALFGIRPPGLWTAIGRSRRVSIYLGEYHQRESAPQGTRGPTLLSIARHDAVVASKIVTLLSSQAHTEDKGPKVETKYVPFVIEHDHIDVHGDGFQKDKARAGEMFSELKTRRQQKESAVLLGSQRVNYLLEHAVADIFQCRPFTPVEQGRLRIPFYHGYRAFDRQVPSCFGGMSPPVETGTPLPGTYYVDEGNRWQCIPWKPDERDAGVVVIRREGENVDLMLFGYSGRATNAIGREVIENAENFWPSGPRERKNRREGDEKTVSRRNVEIGVFICDVRFAGMDEESGTHTDADYRGDTVKVIPMPKTVLERYLK